MKLTSLQRTRRLETVWDEDEAKFEDVSKCRSEVSRKLMLEFKTGRGLNSLIRVEYGGWFLYAVTSTVRSKNCQVFTLLLNYALLRKEYVGRSGAEFEERLDESATVFKRNMVNRAILAAARRGR
ncbi:hypothetical protein TanjilG_25131 [Lupinus angustifolius]|uniref:Uncharacterized protein n=1 Tax=Lupinus angustifolius TaxID=3871 RepID=A0A1J7FML7_LUPAN|nr:hypothetical protein TanjilG_25131 [Lupinus angustifolius]